MFCFQNKDRVKIIRELSLVTEFVIYWVRLDQTRSDFKRLKQQSND